MAKEETLTARHIQILNLVKEGHTDAEIAGELGVAIGTIKNTNQLIFARLGARNRSHALIRALRHHYISLDHEPRKRGER